MMRRVFYNDAEHLKAIVADLEKEGFVLVRDIPAPFAPHLALFEPKPEEPEQPADDADR
jgi:hypothetical protein